jgi:hypothetical protein
MSYNGWVNYETWVTALWLDNEQSSYTDWRERAQSAFENAEGDRENAGYALAQELKDEISNSSDIPESGLFADLVNAALSEVDWDEIAKHLLDEVDASDYSEVLEE